MLIGFGGNLGFYGRSSDGGVYVCGKRK